MLLARIDRPSLEAKGTSWLFDDPFSNQMWSGEWKAIYVYQHSASTMWRDSSPLVAVVSCYGCCYYSIMLCKR